jgi:hypothetical protein
VPTLKVTGWTCSWLSGVKPLNVGAFFSLELFMGDL